MRLHEITGEFEKSKVLKNPSVKEINDILGKSEWGNKTARFVANKGRDIYFWWNNNNISYEGILDKKKEMFSKGYDPGKDVFSGVVEQVGNKIVLKMSPTLNHFFMEVEDGYTGSQKRVNAFIKSFDKTWGWVKKYITLDYYFDIWTGRVKSLIKKYKDFAGWTAKDSKQAKERADIYKRLRAGETDLTFDKRLMKKFWTSGRVKPYTKEEIKKIIDDLKEKGRDN